MSEWWEGVEVPGAPSAVRTRSVRGRDVILKQMERTLPTSPSPSLLMRKSPRLERLAEDDERSEPIILVLKVGRAAKTRRASGKWKAGGSKKEIRA
jgi:hypothetical protein